jgi:hypothetical protein
MKFMIFGLMTLMAASSFASVTHNLTRVGDVKIIQNEKELRLALEAKCLKSQLVDSDAAKARVVVGQRLTSIKLKVENNPFNGKQIFVEAEYLLPESDGNTVPAGTEFGCSMDLTKLAYIYP